MRKSDAEKDVESFLDLFEEDYDPDSDRFSSYDVNDLDFYPEDEFEQAQRVGEFGIYDPLSDNSDE